MQPISNLLHHKVKSKTTTFMKRYTYLKSSLVALFTLCTVLASAQTRRELSLSGFNEIEMSSAFLIDINHGTTYKVTVEAEDADDLNDLEVKVTGKRLVGRFKNNTNWSWHGSNHKRVHFYITLPDLKVLDLSGATRTKVAGFNDLEYLKGTFSGASKVDLAINVDKLLLDISGASNIVLTGKGSIIKLDASGASKLDAMEFAAKDADLDVSGATHVRLYAQKSLNVEASGASSVRYRGTPSVRSDASGASSVKSE